MAQPAAPFQPRELIRAAPFCSPQISSQALGAAQLLTHGWEVFSALCDRNALDGPAPAFNAVSGVFFDLFLFADQAGTLDVLFSAGNTVPRSIMSGATPMVVAASTLTLVAGLRVVGRYVIVRYVNTAGVSSNVEMSSMLRSV